MSGWYLNMVVKTTVSSYGDFEIGNTYAFFSLEFSPDWSMFCDTDILELEHHGSILYKVISRTNCWELKEIDFDLSTKDLQSMLNHLHPYVFVPEFKNRVKGHTLIAPYNVDDIYIDYFKSIGIQVNTHIGIFEMQKDVPKYITELTQFFIQNEDHESIYTYWDLCKDLLAIPDRDLYHDWLIKKFA